MKLSTRLWIGSLLISNILLTIDLARGEISQITLYALMFGMFFFNIDITPQIVEAIMKNIGRLRK